ncbi:MAG: HipA N-terminal domain-containing protein [Ignavibacteriae bacterium]|nr:HipA N-terminal domain-containing protein [Ignavibacteriota bacterium]
MRRANVFMHGKSAGTLEELEQGKKYIFRYREGYAGPPISLTIPVTQQEYAFEMFPPFFDGLLPEGAQLEGLLRQRKIDRNDLFSQIVAVGQDLVGAVTVEEQA